MYRRIYLYFMSNRQLICRIGFVGALIAITWLALVPQQSVIVSTGWDRSDHILAFFVLGGLLDFSTDEWPWWPRKISGLLGYGLAIEVMQLATDDRMFDLLDLVGDTIGVSLYLIAAWFVFPRRRFYCRSAN